MFISSFLHNIDKKGRVFIPAKLREDLGEHFYVSISIDGQQCLNILTEESWRELQERIDALPMLQKKEVRRTIGPMTIDAECDAQGRVLLPPHLREYAGLTDSAYIVGTYDSAEIWSKENWESRKNTLTPDNIASRMANIDF
jgi:MraZ protein